MHPTVGPSRFPNEASMSHPLSAHRSPTIIHETAGWLDTWSWPGQGVTCRGSLAVSSPQIALAFRTGSVSTKHGLYHRESITEWAVTVGFSRFLRCRLETCRETDRPDALQTRGPEVGGSVGRADQVAYQFVETVDELAALPTGGAVQQVRIDMIATHARPGRVRESQQDRQSYLVAAYRAGFDGTRSRRQLRVTSRVPPIRPASVVRGDTSGAGRESGAFVACIQQHRTGSTVESAPAC